MNKAKLKINILILILREMLISFLKFSQGFILFNVRYDDYYNNFFYNNYSKNTNEIKISLNSNNDKFFVDIVF